MSRLYITILFFITVVFAACENSQSEIEALNKKSLMTDEAVKIESYLSQGGKLKAKLTAPLLIRVQADTVYAEFPKSLHVDFYNDFKIVETWLDSKYGKYYESLNKVYLKDSVRVISLRKDTLYCKDLWWDQNRQIFYTDKIALYRSPTQRLDGKFGLEATQDLKTVTFKNVDGEIQTAEGDIPRNATPAAAPVSPIAPN